MRTPGCSEYHSLTRRGFLQGSAAVLTGALMPAWLPRVAMAADGPGSNRDVIIALHLRGGADGLSMLVPHGDRNYYVARPRLSVPPPDSSRNKRAIDLNGFFGFPAPFAPLIPVYQAGQLLGIHATGAIANRWTRSHFDAQHWMDVGKPSDSSLMSGWLGRHLASVPAATPGAPLRGVSLIPSLADSLREGPGTMAVPNPSQYAFQGGWSDLADMEAVLRASYERAPEPMRLAAEQTRATMALLQKVDVDHYRPSGAASYPESDLGRALRSAAALIRAEIGVEAIAVDNHGWDTHNLQGTLDGYLSQQMDDLAKAMYAFWLDLGNSGVTHYTMVVLSEFGRSVDENENGGTEHGTANAMFLMGPNVAGGRVLAEWPGLQRDQLFERQDLRVTIDYRDVLAEVLQKRLGNTQIGTVFPGLTPKPRGVIRA